MEVIDLRDIPITVNGTSEGNTSSKDPFSISVTDGVDPVAPDLVTLTGSALEIQVPAAVSRSTATLMKTGQDTVYRTGDDASISAGRATSFTVLAENNPFGNTNRFTDELGGQTYTNNIVIDWSTYNGSNVLGYRRTVSGSNVTWNNAIDGALAVSIGSFTSGWRLPNYHEIVSIANFSISEGLNYSPFNISTLSYSLWCSNTLIFLTTYSFRYFAYHAWDYQPKANAYRYIPCRTFTVTGTTLS